MVTYNHEKYISQAIEGVLNQKTNFPIELIIGEDCSTDRTLEICLQYQKKFPEIIKVLRHERNVGAQQNVIDVYAHCRGKYIAACEGDDYWTDSLKLQKQVDVLESNPNLEVCHHNLKVIYTNSPDKSHVYHLPENTPKEVATFEDIARANIIATASCVFRNKFFSDFPDWYKSVLSIDYFLHLLNAQKGDVKYINEVMGVYRIHAQGIWSGKRVQEQYSGYIDTIRKCREYFSPRASKQFIAHEIERYTYLCFIEFEQKDYKSFRKRCRKFMSTYKRHIKFRSYLALTNRYILSFVPLGINFYNRISNQLKEKFLT